MSDTFIVGTLQRNILAKLQVLGSSSAFKDVLNVGHNKPCATFVTPFLWLTFGCKEVWPCSDYKWL